MSETKLSGLKACHQMITPVCRANRGGPPAYAVAEQKLRDAYAKYVGAPGNEGVTWHLVLVREDPAHD